MAIRSKYMNLLEKIPHSFKKITWIGLVAVGFLHLALTALCLFANVGGEFIAVLANLIITITTLAALVAVPLLVLLGKRDVALIVFSILSGYWLISTSRDQLSIANLFGGKNPAIYDTAIIFSFIYGLVLLGALAVIVLAFVLKKDLFKQISFLGILSTVAFGLLSAIFWIIVYAQGNTDWTSYITTIDSFVIVPSLVSVGCIYFYLTK